MLKIVGKFEDLFIVNFNLFIIAMLNDYKSHANLFVIFELCNNPYRMQLLSPIRCNPDEIAFLKAKQNMFTMSTSPFSPLT
jgi:hypothetical protein